MNTTHIVHVLVLCPEFLSGFDPQVEELGSTPESAEVCGHMARSESIARKIARLRNQRNLSQDALAAKLQNIRYAVTRNVVANYETERTEPKATHLGAIAQVLEVCILELMPSEREPVVGLDKEIPTRRRRLKRQQPAKSKRQTSCRSDDVHGQIVSVRDLVKHEKKRGPTKGKASR